jgi:ankyrin repeat protein
MIGGKCGGTIYQWTLGWYVSAHQVARTFGHQEVFRLLMERSPDDVKLLASCWLGDGEAVRSLLAGRPDLAKELPEGDRRQTAHAARNNDLAALRLMLAAGLPADSRGQHSGTPLHWAAFHGNADMVREILRRQPPLEWTDADFHAPPLGWAVHGSEHGWHRRTGDYAAAVKALLEAGAKPPGKLEGSPPVREVLRLHGVREAP